MLVPSIYQQKHVDTGKRQAGLRADTENLTDAIAAGALKSSPAIASRLVKAERELTQLEATASAPKATKVLLGVQGGSQRTGDDPVAGRTEPRHGHRP
jgi:hypothetical protein